MFGVEIPGTEGTVYGEGEEWEKVLPLCCKGKGGESSMRLSPSYFGHL